MAEGRPESRDGKDWAVDGKGVQLTFPDGMLISGAAIEAVVKGSGMRLTNAEAAEQIVAADDFATGVAERIAELRQDK